MADKGILFSAPMVRALLDGRKSQTRRMLAIRGHLTFTEFGHSTTPGYDWHFRRADGCWCDFRAADLPLPYAPGDLLWVRETFRATELLESALIGIRYAADQHWRPIDDRPLAALDWVKVYTYAGKDSTRCGEHHEDRGPLVPSIHMPRWCSRISLLVTEVRVQRLQDLSEGDALAEGINYVPDSWSDGGPAPSQIFADLWTTLHTKEGERWQDNPWVIAYTFELV